MGPDAIPVGPNGEGPDNTTSTSAAAAFSTAAVSTPYRKIDGGRWSDNRAKTVQVREGNSTWGWIHAQQHNVSMNMLIKTSKFPKNRIIQGTAIRYETPANEYRCGPFTCTITRTMTMAMIHEGKLTSDGYPRGLITSYCLGAGTCPDWVRRAAG
ncbi:hypothetical protein C5C13_13420 [Clavibacter michiganensis]|nr:hypothetical protein C5C13_13420 [Clavibacter michiganensis]